MNSFTTAPNTRLLVISVGMAAGYDVHSVYQTGGSQQCQFVANAATRDDAIAAARTQAATTGQCWTLILDGRESEWIAPIYPRLEHRVPS